MYFSAKNINRRSMFTQTFSIFRLCYLFFFSVASVIFAVETDVKVAVVHFQPYFQQTSINVERLLELGDEAGSHGAKIVVFPELATSGYSYFNRAQVRQVAETIPGRTTELFSQLAKKHGMYIIIGMPEFETESNLFFNSAVLIDPSGEIAGL